MPRATRALACLCLIGCSRADDDAKIQAIVSAEARLDRALKDADDENDSERAASLLMTRALPDDALAVAEAQDPSTDRGKQRKRELVDLLRERRASIPEYASALRSEDLEVKLAALEHQRALEKRARDLVTRTSP